MRKNENALRTYAAMEHEVYYKISTAKRNLLESLVIKCGETFELAGVTDNMLIMVIEENIKKKVKDYEMINQELQRVAEYDRLIQEFYDLMDRISRV